MQDILAPFKGRNRHVVDRLAELRKLLKEGGELEKTLKGEVGQLMGSSDSLGGDEWIASQSISSKKGALDAQEIAKASGLALAEVDACRKPESEVVTIRVTPRAEAEF